MAMATIWKCLTVLVALISVANAHGYHPKAKQEPMSNDWATRHMAGKQEHHINNFDPGAFFTLHDYDSSGAWTPDEVRRTYGLDDESNADTTEEHKQQMIMDVFELYDPDHSGAITRDEWMRQTAQGRRLPDFGLGPGHHGDDEYEYEIHHFEKYHDENTREEDLTHPEDIAHFKKHDHDADEEERLEVLEGMPIVEANIPQKFRRGGGL